MLKTTGPWDERAARRTSSIERNPWSRSKVTPYLASASCTSALARSTSRLMPEFEPATLTMTSTTPKSWDRAAADVRQDVVDGHERARAERAFDVLELGR